MRTNLPGSSQIQHLWNNGLRRFSDEGKACISKVSGKRILTSSLTPSSRQPQPQGVTKGVAADSGPPAWQRQALVLEPLKHFSEIGGGWGGGGFKGGAAAASSPVAAAVAGGGKDASSIRAGASGMGLPHLSVTRAPGGGGVIVPPLWLSKIVQLG